MPTLCVLKDNVHIYPCKSQYNYRKLQFEGVLKTQSPLLFAYFTRQFSHDMVLVYFRSMFNYLKRKKKLNTTNLRQLLVPAIQHLDFDNVFLTGGILKTLCTNCPNLRVLILKDCGYVVTDSIVEMLFRVGILHNNKFIQL